MFWLPKLTIGAADWLLPLWNTTASSIVAALFSVPRDGSQVDFRAAVATDPGLALWLACKFPGDRIPCGVDDLAEWFLQDAKSHFSGHVEFASADAPASWNSGEWSIRAQRSREVAQRIARQRSESLGSPLSELIGLLHLCPELLSLCGPTIGVGSDDGGPGCLPDWLADVVVHFQRADSSDVVYQVVHQAMEECTSNAPTEGTQAVLESSTTGLAAMLPQMSRMLARLDELEREFDASLESAKLTAMRELAYGASHEINNPLANIATRAQALLIDETDPERRRKLATINSQAFRAHEMISDIMLFAKPPQIDPIDVDLAELIDEILSELAEDAEEQGTELHCELEEKQISVLADRGHLAVALKALIRNSLEAIAMGGYVKLSVRVISGTSSSGSQVEIVVRDNGPGVSGDARSSMFNPFYSGREAGRGLGLGLSKCWRIITLHGGTISLDDSYSDGARFVICLPVTAMQAVDQACAAHG
jgi:signal transduction histidine kinase